MRKIPEKARRVSRVLCGSVGRGLRHTANRLSRLWIQLLVSGVFGSVALVYAHQSKGEEWLATLVEPGPFFAVLGTVGGLVALSSSIFYNHLMQFRNDARTKYRDSYQRLKEQAYEVADRLREIDRDLEWSDPAHDFLEWIGSLRLAEDFPLGGDWEERVSEAVKCIDSGGEEKDFDRKKKSFLLRLLYLEELVHTIGLASIKIVLVSVPLNSVKKSFGLLTCIVLASVFGYLLSHSPSLHPVIVSLPIFFGTFAALFFVEAGYWIHRDTEEFMEQVVGNFDGDSSRGSRKLDQQGN